MTNLTEQTVESILQRMDEELNDIIGASEPERDVHVDEVTKKLQYDGFERESEFSDITDPAPRHMLLYPNILDKLRNPEDTAPIMFARSACDDVSLSTMSSPKSLLNSSLHSGGAKSSLLDDDYDDEFLLLDEGTPSICELTEGSVTSQAIQDAVDTIREEASRVEAALAIDQVHTLKQELLSMTKLLRAQSDQIDYLKQEVKRKDEALAIMELERDLARADMEALQAVRTSEAIRSTRSSARRPALDTSFAAVTLSSSAGESQTSGPQEMHSSVIRTYQGPRRCQGQSMQASIKSDKEWADASIDLRVIEEVCSAYSDSRPLTCAIQSKHVQAEIRIGKEGTLDPSSLSSSSTPSRPRPVQAGTTPGRELSPTLTCPLEECSAKPHYHSLKGTCLVGGNELRMALAATDHDKRRQAPSSPQLYPIHSVTPATS
jgi:hypothetical protein